MEWRTYTVSGVYTFATTNIFGCDSIAKLNLTINNSSTSSEDVTACDSFDWNGTTYTESGIYTFNTNSDNCDSTATLNNYQFNSSSSEENVTACDSLIGMEIILRVEFILFKSSCRL